MKAESAKYDKMTQQKQLMDWTSDANIDINNALKTFQTTYLSVLSSSSSSMLTSSSIVSYAVTASDTSSVAITAGANVQPGTHVINSITSLATGASAKSASAISSSDVSLTAKLSSLSLTNALTFGDDGKLSFSINGKTFSFDSSSTLQNVINTVNSDTDAKATMSYSSLTGKISVVSKATGSASSLNIQNISGNAFADTNAAFGIAQGTSSNGTDAKLNIDGVDVTKSTNNFTIDGITYNLKYTSDTANRFSVDQDIDGAVTKIENFVNAYNTLIDKLQTAVDEKRDSDYQPLTSDQKSSMSDTQITEWDDQVKTGLLEDDPYITKLLDNMRGAFYDKVSGAGTDAAAIGLSTISYQTKGEIYVDETKLRAALQNNPSQVSQVLSNVAYESDSSQQYKECGTFARISDSITSYLNDYSGYRTTSYNSQYKQLETDMSTEQTRLNDREDRYWDEFTKMETALSQMNSQSQWLSQQFSSSGS
jgi:flagellar hook-associated protein 2